MQLNKWISGLTMVALLSGLSSVAMADGGTKGKGKTFSETEFLTTFSGKTKKQVVDKLGQPVKKELSSKPSNAESFIGQPTDTSKPSNVEMWYYANNVKYDAKHTYKTTEITFLNDRCTNIAFFNNH
jgi:hypothetical protein